MRFIKSAVRPEDNSGQAYYFCFLGEDLLVKKNNEGVIFPVLTAEAAKEFGFQDIYSLGLLNGKPSYSVSKADDFIPAGYHWIRLRDFYLDSEIELSNIAGYAKQLFDWNRNYRFCGRCASETVVLPNEHARFCEKCELINYPRISPAIITAVIKDNQILLARGSKFPDKKMFSVLAGFLEPGESLEECVKREVFEEVSIRVKNVRYFKSQPWPFPDSLMIGFTAEYESGDINIDKNEIAEAGWFKSDSLPKVPARRSISKELIDWFVGIKNS